MESRPHSTSYTVLGVDIGVIHLALVLVRVDQPGWQSEVRTPPALTILNTCLVNLMSAELGHERTTSCRLYHSNMACDRVDHLIQACEDEFFNRCDLLVIELQPLGGMRDIEQLLVKRYRDRVRLISPNRIHRWLGITGMSYSVRKERQEQEAVRRGFSCASATCDRPCLVHGTGLTQLHVPRHEQRYHDYADAYLIVLYAALHPSKVVVDDQVVDDSPNTTSYTMPADSSEDIDLCDNTTSLTGGAAADEIDDDDEDAKKSTPTSVSKALMFLDSFRYRPSSQR